jgi:LmbE family N-acetylglucosaminyl deacetylase
MKRDDTDFKNRALLAVFAHPDDESLACGGLLASCARRGARVAVCCATRGELGQRRGLRSPKVDLRNVRARELRNAARILGVTDVVLLHFHDGMLPWTNSRRLESAIRQTLRRFRPDVVVTFGEDGLYGHPDHIAIHERTTAVVTRLGRKAPALYYVTSPKGSMRAVVRHVERARSNGARPRRPATKILGIEDADAFGAVAARPTLVIDVGRFAAQKLAAIKCHRTQLVDDALARLTVPDAKRLLAIEQFNRAPSAARGAMDDAPFIEQLAVKP